MSMPIKKVGMHKDCHACLAQLKINIKGMLSGFTAIGAPLVLC
jgi:hypothetical protein